MAEELLGPIDAIIHQPYGHAGITFEIQAHSGDFILKTKDQTGAFDHTEHHIAVLASLGISTPTVAGRGSCTDFEYILLCKIPGRDLGSVLSQLTPHEMEELAREVVTIERKVASLSQGLGFGWTPMKVPGLFSSWSEVIARDSRACPKAVLEEISKWKGYFESVEPVCFLDDLTVKNVIVQGGKFQGIVDLDEVCYGDPLYWLSLTEVTTILDVGLRGAYYGEKLREFWELSRQESAACDLYNVIQAWFFLSKGTGHKLLEQWTSSRFERVRGFLS